MAPPKPDFLRSLFWDIDFEKFKPQKWPKYTIERILELGREDALRWMMKNFTEDQIKESLKNSRQLTARSANFWALYYDIPKEDIRCLTESFRETHRAVWPY